MPQPDTASEYARELRTWRERRGLSKKALAERMAYDRSYVSHIEGSNLLPTEDFTRRAEEVLRTGGALWACWEAYLDARSTAHRAPDGRGVDRDLRTIEFVAWLAEHSAGGFRETYDAVSALADQLDSEPAATRYERDHARQQVTRQQIAAAVLTYYGPAAGGFYRAHVGEADIGLSILGQPRWFNTVIELGTEHEAFQFVEPAPSALRLGEVETRASVRRLAAVEVAGTVMVNNQLYRLLDVSVDAGTVTATVTLSDFAAYALTADLLEGELLDTIISTNPGADSSAASGAMPLRDTYLPTTASAFSLDERICVGGPVALLAIARSTRHGGDRDYLLLMQERSSAVLNVTGRLAVIPKAFHQPIGEPAGEARLSMTLQRELEEELLGRQDLEQLSRSDYRRVDPLHRQHVSEPLAWLLDRHGTGAYRTEFTGFGFNMVTGNYEFAGLVVVEDEAWWDTFGHVIETNWETLRVRRYSSLDTNGLRTLAQDPRWSNEGLFAFLQGLHRLAETDTSGRVAAPTITLET